MTHHDKRIAALRATLHERSLDAIVIEQPHSRRYLSGFSGSTGLLVVSPDEVVLITDSRYYERVKAEAPGVTLVRAGHELLEHLASQLERIAAIRVGFENQYITVARFDQLRQEVPAPEWIAVGNAIDRMRAIKAPVELDAITRAAAITDAAMRFAFETAAPGMTERDLAWAIEKHMREGGAEGLAFDIIVACGANSAVPHHQASDTPIEAGQPIVIDMGAKVEGYCADLTRTFSLGPAADPDYQTVWQLVMDANHTAVDRCRPGMTGREADALARDVIAAAGYGDYFGHPLGHGVGLNVHELPRLAYAADETPLAAGMVTSIEPGVYLPGRFGVRSEDLAVIEPDGVRLISQVAHQAVIM